MMKSELTNEQRKILIEGLQNYYSVVSPNLHPLVQSPFKEWLEKIETTEDKNLFALYDMIFSYYKKSDKKINKKTLFKNEVLSILKELNYDRKKDAKRP